MSFWTKLSCAFFECLHLGCKKANAKIQTPKFGLFNEHIYCPHITNIGLIWGFNIAMSTEK